MKKALLGICTGLLLSGSAVAQDVHFTQYFTSPLTLNPAMTGLINEDLRLAANYRSQWGTVSSTPYVTGTFSFDAALLKNKLPDGDALGFGLMALYDQSGSGGLTNTTVGASLAYHKAFGRDRTNHISIGVQANEVQKSIDAKKLTFEDMYSGSGSFSNTTLEKFTSQAFTYVDFNGGIMYSGKVTDKSTAYIGYSYYHLTQPVESFMTNNDYSIHGRQTVYLGGSFEMNDRAVLYASGLFQSQASAVEAVIGAAMGFVLNPGHDLEYQRNTIFYLGGWYRYGDAVCPYVGIEWAKMRLGISYDVNLSTFTPATSGLGGYEISLLFFGKLNKHERSESYSWSCPKVF